MAIHARCMFVEIAKIPDSLVEHIDFDIEDGSEESLKPPQISPFRHLTILGRLYSNENCSFECDHSFANKSMTV
jgi:hypothetical protein